MYRQLFQQTRISWLLAREKVNAVKLINNGFDLGSEASCDIGGEMLVNS